MKNLIPVIGGCLVILSISFVFWSAIVFGIVKLIHHFSPHFVFGMSDFGIAVIGGILLTTLSWLSR